MLGWSKKQPSTADLSTTKATILDDSTPSHIPKKYISCLQQHFGHKTFRPLQWQIIHAILEQQRDVCAIMSTGYGKSLTYQFPAFYLDKVVVVISPLIALMEDQVNALNKKQERACLLGTAQDDPCIVQRILNLDFRLIYATPEYIMGGSGLKLLTDLDKNLALIAIDEAHCISQWGHEFRPAYRELQKLRTIAQQVQLLALTATATPRVRNDICTSLMMHMPHLLCSSFDRPNLEFSVRVKRKNQIWLQLKMYLSWASRMSGSVIIYSNTTRAAEKITNVLNLHGVPCQSYHGKLPLLTKRSHQQDFMSDKVRVISATTAFGMGIDKQNVRLVIHYGAPSDIERYYQEIGRAGRDGLTAKCVLFYSHADSMINKLLQIRQLPSLYRGVELQYLAKQMLDYTRTQNCRRHFLLSYFGDIKGLAGLQPHQKCCDNCRQLQYKVDYQRFYKGLNAKGQLDVSQDAFYMLGLLRDTRGTFGMCKIILTLRGSRSKSLAAECTQHKYFGKCAHKPEEWYKVLAENLEEQGYIVYNYKNSMASSFGFVLPQATLKACIWLDAKDAEREAIVIEPYSELLQFLERQVHKEDAAETSETTPGQHEENMMQVNERRLVKKALQSLCQKLSKDLFLPLRMIASDKALEQLAVAKPTNMKSLIACQLDGFSQLKYVRFGPELLKCLVKAVKESKVSDNGSNAKQSESVTTVEPVPTTQIRKREPSKDLWSSDSEFAVDFKQIDEAVSLSQHNLNAAQVPDLNSDKALCSLNSDLAVDFKQIDEAVSLSQNNLSATQVPDLKSDKDLWSSDSDLDVDFKQIDEAVSISQNNLSATQVPDLKSDKDLWSSDSDLDVDFKQIDEAVSISQNNLCATQYPVFNSDSHEAWDFNALDEEVQQQLERTTSVENIQNQNANLNTDKALCSSDSDLDVDFKQIDEAVSLSQNNLSATQVPDLKSDKDLWSSDSNLDVDFKQIDEAVSISQNNLCATQYPVFNSDSHEAWDFNALDEEVQQQLERTTSVENIQNQNANKSELDLLIFDYLEMVGGEEEPGAIMPKRNRQQVDNNDEEPNFKANKLSSEL